MRLNLLSRAGLWRSLYLCGFIVLAVLAVWRGRGMVGMAAANLGALELSKLYAGGPSAGEALDAEARYRQALAWGGEQPRYLHGLAYALYAQGRSAEAAALWRQVEGSAERFMLQGYLARLTDDYASSLEWYTAAAVVAPELADAKYYVGVAEDQLGNSASAEAAFRKALTAKRFETVGRSDVYTQLAGTIAQRASPPGWQDVADLLVKALENDDFRSPMSTRSQARFWYAEALRQQGKVDNAMTELGALVADDANEYWARLRLADLLWNRRKDAGQAEALLKQALAVAPERVQAYLALGRLYQATGRAGEAVPLLRRVLELDPNNAEAQSRLEESQE